MQRRDFLLGAGAGLGLGGLAGRSAQSTAPESNAGCAASTSTDERFSLPRVRAEPDRIVAVTVCTRPFRPQGPRIESERLGRKTVVHNYGHGGTGWSLSWGSSTLALRHVLETKVRDVAVIGCGVMGLTSGLLAQRAGLKVRIYAKDRPPEVRSMLATGNWSPGSRFCTAEHATPELVSRWEEMARISFRAYQFMLGLPGDPIEWRDAYIVRDEDFQLAPSLNPEPPYPALESRLSDLVPHAHNLVPGTHPFPTPYVRRFTNMIFNFSVYMRMLVADFLAAGGEIETRDFESPRDVAKLREKTIINATGYGARALFGDESLIPVRGQLLRLIPQPEITYGLIYNSSLFMIPRRDGIVLQTREADRFNSEDTTPDRAEAERAVQMLAGLNARLCA
jgi:hypothetical protein